MNTEESTQFETAYREHHKDLRNLASFYGIPQGEIEDLIHDTFVMYARYCDSQEQAESGGRALLNRILLSRCMDFHRNKEKRFHYQMDEEDLTEKEDRIRSGQAEPPDYIISKERYLALLDEICKMPRSWRQVVELKAFQGLSIEEMSKVLDITDKACYARLGRIRRHLRTLLNDENWP